MSDFQSNTKVKISSEKNFGLVFSIFFLIVGVWNFYFNEVYYSLFIISLFFFIFSFIFPMIFYYPNKLWFKLGMLLGFIISPIVMFIIFFATFLPLSIILKLIGKDFLRKKTKPSLSSYWEKRIEEPQEMTNQF